MTKQYRSCPVRRGCPGQGPERESCSLRAQGDPGPAPQPAPPRGPGWAEELKGGCRLAMVILPTPTTPYLLFSNTVTRLDTEVSFSLLAASILQASRVPGGRERALQPVHSATPTWGHRWAKASGICSSLSQGLSRPRGQLQSEERGSGSRATALKRKGWCSPKGEELIQPHAPFQGLTFHSCRPPLAETTQQGPMGPRGSFWSWALGCILGWSISSQPLSQGSGASPWSSLSSFFSASDLVHYCKKTAFFFFFLI